MHENRLEKLHGYLFLPIEAQGYVFDTYDLLIQLHEGVYHHNIAIALPDHPSLKNTHFKKNSAIQVANFVHIGVTEKFLDG